MEVDLVEQEIHKSEGRILFFHAPCVATGWGPQVALARLPVVVVQLSPPVVLTEPLRHWHSVH
eukprot:5014677-Amphidinium_carterae.3